MDNGIDEKISRNCWSDHFVPIAGGVQWAKWCVVRLKFVVGTQPVAISLSLADPHPGTAYPHAPFAVPLAVPAGHHAYTNGMPG